MRESELWDAQQAKTLVASSNLRKLKLVTKLMMAFGLAVFATACAVASISGDVELFMTAVAVLAFWAAILLAQYASFENDYSRELEPKPEPAPAPQGGLIMD